VVVQGIIQHICCEIVPEKRLLRLVVEGVNQAFSKSCWDRLVVSPSHLPISEG
jgi:hypothetical protein